MGGQVPGAPPQNLGQVPGQPLDLSSALGQPLPESQQQQTLGAPTLGTPVQGGQQNPQLVLAPSSDPKDAYDLSYGYILRGEFDLAEASFKQFLTQFPNDPLAGNAQYWLGESLFARGSYRDAADAFLKGYSDYPASAKAPDSLYKLGMSLKELGQAEAACSSFSEIARRYPNAPQAVRERARSEMQKSGC
jgi:tol-pal system protein YbgF